MATRTNVRSYDRWRENRDQQPSDQSRDCRGRYCDLMLRDEDVDLRDKLAYSLQRYVALQEFAADAQASGGVRIEKIDRSRHHMHVSPPIHHRDWVAITDMVGRAIELR